MKRVATAVVLIPLIFALIFIFADWLFVLALGIVAILSILEYLRLSAPFGDPSYAVSLTVVGSIFLLLTINAFTNGEAKGLPFLATVIGSLLLLLPFLFIGRPMLSLDFSKSLIGSSLSLLGLLYVCAPLICLLAIRKIHLLGNYFLVILLLAVWSGDIAAFYVGRLLGKHKLAPRVSPGKTWEGAIASLIFAVVVVVIVTEWAGPKLSGTRVSTHFDSSDWITLVNVGAPPIWVPICIGASVNIAAQLGDLAESMLKRAAGVKDSGSLLPGHGGMLDRLDALLFAAPVGMLLFLFTRNLFNASAAISVY